ncbi:MAG: hypothetical protein EBR09_16815 [Proteobacteria bacterium]|nr:hypothetical protein [Pseudomonadota bacterium]
MLSRLARSCIVRERLLTASPGAAALRFERRAGGIFAGAARARLEREVFFGAGAVNGIWRWAHTKLALMTMPFIRSCRNKI